MQKQYLIKRILLLAVIILTVSAGGIHASDIPKYTTEWGFYGTITEGNGMLVSQVTPKSAAADAGLQSGDIIIAMNGVAVKSFSAFARRPPYVPVKLLVRRQDTEIERTILPRGLVKLEVLDLKQKFTIPGVPAHENPSAVSAIDALDYINVLDQVVLDPKSGQITIIGHYDKDYDTGVIPFLDLLKTALVYPAPVLNLKPTPDTKKEFIEIGLRKEYATFEQMIAAVRGHPELERDRQLMIKEMSKAYGLTPDEYVAWYNYVKLDKNKEIFPPSPIRGIQVKVFSKLGYSEVAKALELSFQNTPDAAIKALQVLGRSDEARTILNQNSANSDMMVGALMGATYLAILKDTKLASPEQLATLHDRYIAQSMTWQTVLKTAQNFLMPYQPKNSKPNIMNEAFNRITLSTPAMLLLERVHPGYSYIEPINLDKNSQLARIMYEADYALKSISVMPELFQNIPGSRTKMEYGIENRLMDGEKRQFLHVWLEPKMVQMTVSPERTVVAFVSSQMLFSAGDDADYWNLPPDKELNHEYDAWCAQVMNHYDAYARIIPAFHKVREAAKIIALAKWIIAEKIPLDLRTVTQEKWDMPDKVPIFWVLMQSYFQPKGKADYVGQIDRMANGGISFERSNWTRMTPSTISETRVADQLTLSAGLGQKAVKALKDGDMEQARYLAELSAQAMSGGLSRANLAKLNIVVPEAKPVPVSPANVQLQKEVIKKTHQLIVTLGQDPSSIGTATSTLAQLNRLYDQVRDNPAAASDYLLQLQTGKLPPTVTAQTTAAKPPTDTVCGESSLGATTLSAEREEYLTKKMNEAQDRLRHINEALKKLVAINVAQQAEINKLTAEITEQYKKAQDRAWDVVFDLLTSVSLDAFGAEQVKRVKGIEDAITGKIALKTTPLNAAALQKVEEEIKLLQSTKFRLEEAYSSTDNLIALFKGVSYANNIDDWQRKNQSAWERAKTSLALLGNLALDHPALEKWLGKKAFFAGEKLWQVAAMGKMAYYAWGFYMDILTQIAIWEPMTANLQNNLNYNTQAMESLRQKAAKTYREIGCIEEKLR
ncbi:MAG: PDZ domain-containing protein [Proteobacteria bacterium]|nr:PDZ domain-containing protein [Pseudomonadota bacterium]